MFVLLRTKMNRFEFKDFCSTFRASWQLMKRKPDSDFDNAAHISNIFPSHNFLVGSRAGDEILCRR